MKTKTILLALLVASTLVAFAPSASASPPTCNDQHALVTYVDCIADCVTGQDAIEFWTSGLTCYPTN